MKYDVVVRGATGDLNDHEVVHGDFFSVEDGVLYVNDEAGKHLHAFAPGWVGVTVEREDGAQPHTVWAKLNQVPALVEFEVEVKAGDSPASMKLLLGKNYRFLLPDGTELYTHTAD